MILKQLDPSPSRATGLIVKYRNGMFARAICSPRDDGSSDERVKLIQSFSHSLDFQTCIERQLATGLNYSKN